MYDYLSVSSIDVYLQAACAPEGTIKPLNPPGENGSADGISSVDAVASESDHNGDVQPADATVSTLPAIEEGGEQKVST